MLPIRDSYPPSVVVVLAAAAAWTLPSLLPQWTPSFRSLDLRFKDKVAAAKAKVAAIVATVAAVDAILVPVGSGAANG